jgi:hypothetical protein
MAVRRALVERKDGGDGPASFARDESVATMVSGLSRDFASCSRLSRSMISS